MDLLRRAFSLVPEYLRTPNRTKFAAALITVCSSAAFSRAETLDDHSLLWP
jgi:hypothetical protein